MKLEVLISTMNTEDMSLLERMKVQTDAVVINQCQKEEEERFEYLGRQIKWLSYNERGLSRSRNRALAAATGDICLIADDDVIYDEGYEEKILKAYEDYPEADVIAFQMIRTGKERQKIFRKKVSKENWISCMKISSVEMTFKRQSIKEKGIEFNPLFGAGAYFNNGEENIFLYDCLRKKLKILYIPVVIGSVCCDESSWFEGYNPHYFESMGAGYYGMSQKWGWALCMQHLLRHYKLYKNSMSFIKIAYYMKQGRKACKRLKRGVEGKTRSFIVGNFNDVNGPSLVNQSLRKERKEQSRYSLAKTKIGRVIEVLVKTIGMDVVGFSGLSQIDRIGIKWAKILKKPTFYIMHGYVERELLLEQEENSKLIELERYVLKNVDKIIPVSKNFEEYLKEEIPEFKTKFEYMNNGVDWGAMDKIHVHRRESGKEYWITSIGGGLHRKNNLTICKGIEMIKDQVEYPIRYKIIGKAGRDIEVICKYPFVEYLGEISHRDVLECLGQTHVYIQNSYFEPFSLAVVEALMCGCDVLIAKEVGAISILEGVEKEDLIEDNDNPEEIAQKLLTHLKGSNNQRIVTQMNQKETSWQASNDQLTQIIGRL